MDSSPEIIHPYPRVPLLPTIRYRETANVLILLYVAILYSNDYVEMIVIQAI